MAAKEASSSYKYVLITADPSDFIPPFEYKLDASPPPMVYLMHTNFNSENRLNRPPSDATHEATVEMELRDGRGSLCEYILG